MNTEIVTLEYPVEYRVFFKKKVVSILRLRRPTMKDFEAVDPNAPLTMGKLVSRVSGVPYRVIERMDPVDWKRVNDRIEMMLKPTK